jgi:catechol 2,3-dioxygenase-like lactoylglutathione lyase family enzyme
MKIEHIALGYNSEAEADKFFITLLGLKKIRSKSVSSELIKAFFGVKGEYKFVHYAGNEVNFEVFITNDKSSVKDVFTHSCLIVENRDEFLSKSSSMGYDIVKVPRNESNSYYLFIKDTFGNLYEIKEK